MKQDQIEHIDPSLLIPHPDNSMKHGDEQITQLVASFEQFGFNGVIVIDEGNVVLAGHGRRLAAIRAGLKTVNCLRRTGLNDAQKRAYIIADNKIGRDGEWDQEVLSQQLEMLAGDGFDLDSLGISQAALASLTDSGTKKGGASSSTEGTEPARKRRRGIKAIDDVIAERERQISEEAWTLEHDDKHTDGALSLAGVCYAEWEHNEFPEGSGHSLVPINWPWSEESWKPAGLRRNLVKAGALIIAEIERLDRAEAVAAAALKKAAAAPKKVKAS